MDPKPSCGMPPRNCQNFAPTIVFLRIAYSLGLSPVRNGGFSIYGSHWLATMPPQQRQVTSDSDFNKPAMRKTQELCELARLQIASWTPVILAGAAWGPWPAISSQASVHGARTAVSHEHSGSSILQS
jgi:hypothetical protein